MTALKAVTETKWHLSLSPCDKNVFHVWGMFWQHFPNFGLTPAQVLVNEFSWVDSLDSASSHSFQQGASYILKLNLLRVHTVI